MKNESSAASFEALRRKLAFRSWHRGTKEMDLLLGRFADAHLPGFAPAELELYAALLTENDPDLYDWVTGKAEPPAPNAVLEKLRGFYISGSR